MSITGILKALDSEIENLKAVRNLLSDHPTVKHNLTPAGRERIADAVRKRWALEKAEKADRLKQA